jgi:hypothetical protein
MHIKLTSTSAKQYHFCFFDSLFTMEPDKPMPFRTPSFSLGPSSDLKRPALTNPPVPRKFSKIGKTYGGSDDQNIQFKTERETGETAFLYKGLFPCIKWGYDKFFCPTISSETGAFVAMIGDFDPNADMEWAPGKKLVTLDEGQFLRLCAFVYSGQTEIRRDPGTTIERNPRLSALLGLGDGLFFSWSGMLSNDGGNIALANIQQMRLDNTTGEMVFAA